MKSQHPVSISLVVCLILVGVAYLLAVSTAQAQQPADGRINKMPWINSYGAVAVYCVGQTGRPGVSFSGGGISVLNGAGQTVLFAPEAKITAAQTQANNTNMPLAVVTQSVYTLIARPGGYLRLVSAPDAEGKTYLGEWINCTAVSSEAAASAPTLPFCVPQFIRNEADSGFACGNCYNGIDDDCNGKIDKADFSCQYYCLSAR